MVDQHIGDLSPDAGVRRPTVVDVADHAHVSRQTVSNALNTPHLLRPETLERVQRSIKELGYRPNHAAQALRTQTSRLIALRLRRQPDLEVEELLSSLSAAFRQRGYDVLVFSACTDDEEIRVFEDLLRRNVVDAFILTGPRAGDQRVQWLLSRRALFACLGRPWGDVAPPRYPWVDIDCAAGIASAVDHLVEKGHRRIGFLGSVRDGGPSDDKHAGWLGAMRRQALPTRGLAQRGPDSLHSGALLAGALLGRSVPPTALVCASDLLAVGAMRQAKARGLHPGVDVSVVGFGDSPFAMACEPTLSTVVRPLDVVAEVLADLSLRRLYGDSQEFAGELVKPSLVLRESSRPASD